MATDYAKSDCLADAMRHADNLDEIPLIYICQGPPRCDRTSDGPPAECPWCVKIRADDPRDPDQIIAEMQRMQS